jgi:hypothetical protein
MLCDEFWRRFAQVDARPVRIDNRTRARNRRRTKPQRAASTSR